MLGCANQAGEDNRNVARMASLLAGLPVEVSGATVNRLCGSGLEAIAVAARAIKAGEGDFYIAGGVENMSRSPFVMPKAESAFTRQRRDPRHHDRLALRQPQDGSRLRRRSPGCHGGERGQRASGVAGGSGCLRPAQPADGRHRRRRRAGSRTRSSRCRRGVAARWSRSRDDEHIRPETTLEQLGRLKPAFQSGGTVTAGNSSGVNDGAAAMIIASEAAVKRPRAQPQGRGWSVWPRPVCRHASWGLGPVPATRKLLARLGLGIDEIDLIELNEAFAAQGIAVLRQLGLPEDAEHVNPNGGAIALGHPLGMSGVRLVLTAVRELELRQDRSVRSAPCASASGRAFPPSIERV